MGIRRYFTLYLFVIHGVSRLFIIIGRQLGYEVLQRHWNMDSLAYVFFFASRDIYIEREREKERKREYHITTIMQTIKPFCFHCRYFDGIPWCVSALGR